MVSAPATGDLTPGNAANLPGLAVLLIAWAWASREAQEANAAPATPLAISFIKERQFS